MMRGCQELDEFGEDRLSCGSLWKREDDGDEGMVGMYNRLVNENVLGGYYKNDGVGEIGMDYNKWEMG